MSPPPSIDANTFKILLLTEGDERVKIIQSLNYSRPKRNEVKNV